MTEAQARKLGLKPKGKPAKDRRGAKGPYKTRCATCGEIFTGRKAEDDHLASTGHHRYELEMTSGE